MERTLRIGKGQLKYLEHIMSKKGLENVKLTRNIEGNRHTRSQRTTYPTSLCEWMTIRWEGLSKGQNQMREIESYGGARSAMF